MAKAQEVMALVRAHIDGDNERFRAIVLQIAAHAAGSSANVAKSLRELAAKPPRPQQMTALRPQVESLLVVSSAVVDIMDMALDASARLKIDRFLLEQGSSAKLIEHGLRPASKLLFTGPPGTGKTMCSSAIAHALSLPLIRVQLHGVIASHLGETAGHLGKVFQSIREMRGVYLFDEFDALAADRGTTGNDVTEMRRVVNSLLQFVEMDDSDSVIIAATNHPDLIDRAMFRRFDQVIDFPLPTVEIAEYLVRARLLWSTDIDWAAVRVASIGIGHADLTSACHHVNKDAVIGDRDRITTKEIVAAIEARRVRAGDSLDASRVTS